MPDSHGSIFAQFAKASVSKEDSASNDESSTPLPKGVVLGKDGKPYEHPILYLDLTNHLFAAVEHVRPPLIG